MRSRTAMFGGTFDPVHNAHIAIARAAADRFGLEKILFVPAANPPHKPERTTAPYEDRVRMLQLACAADPRFEISRIEEGSERSYSIITIRKLLDAGFAPLAFLIGADAFAEITTWRRWREVVASVEFIVVTRRGSSWHAPEGAVVRELAGIDSDVSSSAVRQAIAAGSDEVSVPPPVLTYIREHGLYRL
jgi:nicotinate-nucleotide adenylyltransferase